MLPIYCKTDHAILLLAAPDARGVLRFPSTPEAVLPGLHVPVKPLISINEQLVEAATDFLAKDLSRHLHVWQEFADELTLPDGRQATLYLARIEHPAIQADPSWPHMPDLLRGLPRERIRIPYLRAWQILQGGLKLNTKAVDIEEVRKHFED